MASRSTNRTLAAALTRGDRSTIGRWFWTIDKTLLIIIFALVAAGIVAVAAASPAAARRLSGTALRFDDLYFLYRQLGWVALGLPLMLATSMLDMRLLKRLAVIGTLGCLVALLLVPFIGGGANGAARWIQLPGFQFQPSEFFKPCFIVTTAWLLSLKVEDRSLPTMQISLGLLGMALICLIAQPDVGQSALISAVWLTQAMLAGLSLTIVGALAGLGIVGLVAAYFTLDHFAAQPQFSHLSGPDAMPLWLSLSSIFLLNDAALFNPFQTDYLLWVDAAALLALPAGGLQYAVQQLTSDARLWLPCGAAPEREGLEHATRLWLDSPLEAILFSVRGDVVGGQRSAIHAFNAAYYSCLDRLFANGLTCSRSEYLTLLAHSHRPLCNLQNGRRLPLQ